MGKRLNSEELVDVGRAIYEALGRNPRAKLSDSARRALKAYYARCPNVFKLRTYRRGAKP